MAKKPATLDLFSASPISLKACEVEALKADEVKGHGKTGKTVTSGLDSAFAHRRGSYTSWAVSQVEALEGGYIF